MHNRNERNTLHKNEIAQRRTRYRAGTPQVSRQLQRVIPFAIAALCVLASAIEAPAATRNGECVERSALKAEKAPAETPILAAKVTAQYGKNPTDITKKVPEIEQAIRKLDPVFFTHQANNWTPKPNKAVLLHDGREVVLMTGCRVSSHCDATGYAMIYVPSNQSLAIVEQTETPNRFLVLGAPDQNLRGALFKLAASTLHERSGEAAATAKTLATVTLLPQKVTDQRYGDPFTKPEILAAIHKVYGDAMVGADSSCSVRFSDGHEYLLISGTSSNADGEVPHGVAYDPREKTAYVLRNDEQGSKPHFFGNPNADMRNVLTVVASGCINIRVQKGLDPYGTETVAPTPCAGAATPPNASGTATVAH